MDETLVLPLAYAFHLDWFDPAGSAVFVKLLQGLSEKMEVMSRPFCTLSLRGRPPLWAVILTAEEHVPNGIFWSLHAPEMSHSRVCEPVFTKSCEWAWKRCLGQSHSPSCESWVGEGQEGKDDD